MPRRPMTPAVAARPDDLMWTVGEPTGGLPTTTADKIAWCRQHDAKG